MKLDYRPDWRTYDYGTLEFCQGFTPVNSGYAVSFGGREFFPTATLAGNCLGARSIKTETGSIRIFFGSDAKIEEITKVGTDLYLTDRSRTSGGAYATGSNRWWFTQGLAYSQVFATNNSDKIQRSTGITFSDYSGNGIPNRAKILLTQSNALLALNYEDGTAQFPNPVPNGIKTSTRGDASNWQAGVSSEATALKLVETPGEIVAGATLHDVVIAWKRTSMYVGRFVGGDEIWQFNLLSPNVGCYGMEAWCATPAGIIFAGEAGIYLFDGSVPRPIDAGIRQAIQFDIGSNNDFGSGIMFGVDEYLGCVFMYVPNPDNTARFRCYAYNYRTEKWSIAYPFYNDGVTYAGTDWGVKSSSTGNAYTGCQAVIRDLTTIDVRRFKSGLGYDDNTGHFVVCSEKKFLVLNQRTAGAGDALGVSAYLQTNLFRVNDAPWNYDAQIKRVEPIFVPITYKHVTSGAGSLFNMYCLINGNTFTWSSSDSRFDGFAVAKRFYVSVGSTDERYALSDLWMDTKVVGKT